MPSVVQDRDIRQNIGYTFGSDKIADTKNYRGRRNPHPIAGMPGMGRR
jgi:hypothetical protein